MMVCEQVVKVEVCLSEGFACDIVAEGHQTVCRQKFTSHRWTLLISSIRSFSSVRSSLHLTMRHYWSGKPVFEFSFSAVSQQSLKIAAT